MQQRAGPNALTGHSMGLAAGLAGFKGSLHRSAISPESSAGIARVGLQSAPAAALTAHWRSLHSARPPVIVNSQQQALGQDGGGSGSGKRGAPPPLFAVSQRRSLLASCHGSPCKPHQQLCIPSNKPPLLSVALQVVAAAPDAVARQRIDKMSGEVVDSNPYSRLMALQRMGIVKDYEQIRNKTVRQGL